ncbi:MAG: CBS domain-containing protein [Gemmatimonadetes bacterium]|nr:CBS domain-containing protein [Gemmatimonadota bacterium]
MRLTDVLHPDHIVAPLEADTVQAAVLSLIERLVATGAVAKSETLEHLAAEERIRDVIHVGERVLLPHTRTDAVDHLVVALGVTPAPLRSSGVGSTGAEQVVVLVAAPPAMASQYLQLVAALARALRSESVVDRLVAARSAEDVIGISEIKDLVLQPRLTVRDIMTQRVFRVFPDTPVLELIELMNRHNLNAVPVIGEKREVLGMVTDRDLLRHLHARVQRVGSPQPAEQDRQQSNQPALVRDIMSRSVMCISEDQGVAEVASIMINKDVERVPVVTEGRLTGFLTRSDIIRKLFVS